MSQPYLILHRVRGEPAFDIAERATCPFCISGNKHREGYAEVCDECDGEGFWWIVSTSGHRAYPYRSWDLDDLYDGSDMDMPKPTYVLDTVDPPASLPDHYPQRKAPPEAKGKALLDLLGLKPKTNYAPINRRL